MGVLRSPLLRFRGWRRHGHAAGCLVRQHADRGPQDPGRAPGQGADQRRGEASCRRGHGGARQGEPTVRRKVRREGGANDAGLHLRDPRAHAPLR